MESGRRRPLQRKEPSPPNDIASTTAASTTSATTGSGRAAYTSPATYKTFGQLLLTSPSDVNNSDGDDISIDDGASSSTSMWTMPSTAVWTMPSTSVLTMPSTSVLTMPSTSVLTMPSTSVWTMPSTAATSDHLNGPNTAPFSSTQRQPFYAKQKYRPFWSDRSAEGAEKSTDSDDILAPNELNGEGRSADGRIPPWARLRKVSTTADVVQWREKGGGLKKYTGLTTIRHQMDGISPSMSAERSVKAEPKMPKERHGVAAVKPKTYASGVETYASPLKDIQLLDVGSTASSSTSNSDEDDLQSVVEQHQLDEALLREMSAAISGKAMAQEIVGRDEIGVKMLPQETTTRHSENPFPSILNSYIDPPQSLVGAADCATKRVAIRSGKSGGCGDGTAPAELILSCGSCSCSRCQCSSLPETCNGQNCPICPSVCQCPTECGCEASSSSSFNSFQNGVELAESQAVQQSSQQQQYYNMPWSGQQFYSGGQEGYGAVGGTALNAAFDSLQCFSGDQLVRTARGAVRMDQLRLGDLVLSMDESLISFSPVVMFLHRKPSESANFVRIHTELGHRLQLTGLHLLWVGCAGRLRLIRARELRPGQCVYALDGREMEKEKILWRRRGNRTERVWQRERAEQLRMVPSRIERIEQVNDRGIYAPLTANGNILVNDVLASCHVNMAAQTLQQTFFNWWRALTAFGHKIRTIVFASGLWNFADECCRTGQNQPAGDGQQQQQNVEGDLPLGVRLVISVLDSLMPDSILLPPIN
uniref:Hint domain-containing protein n=1 Tax=Globodera rostochiensis TaxID=31243 RepID=A0A914H0B9_GLORO